MKRGLALLLALLALFSLAACGGGSGDSSGKPPAELDLTPSAALSDDIYSFQIQLDGDVYTVPFPLQQLLDSGWEVDVDLTEVYEPLTYGTLVARKWGMIKGLHVLNNSLTDSLPLSDLEVGGFDTTVEDAEAGLSVVLPGGITFGATYDEVVAAYGEPDEISHFGMDKEAAVSDIGYTGPVNEYGESSRWMLFFDEETGELDDIRVKRWTNP